MPESVLPSFPGIGVNMAKLGSEKRPLVLRVQDPDRGREVSDRCEEAGAYFIVGIEPDRPEDISDLERFLGAPAVRRLQPKIGRNDPCPCGSGKKYKKCCLASDRERALDERGMKQPEDAAAADRISLVPSCDEGLDGYSNRVVDLIHKGDLVAAEKACDELEKKYPDSIDCPDRRAMLCDARGEIQQAISYNERCLEIIAAAPKGSYETAFIYEEAIVRLRSALAANSNNSGNDV
jgi:SWIM/SEC-C metal-binding protein